MDISSIKFAPDGLIPAAVTDFYTGKLLMLAYMNKESLETTVREGTTCFYSRSRKTLWRKGETSGNRQRVVYIKTDCDWDALEVCVIKEGPACHTGAESCFNDILFGEDKTNFSLDTLYSFLEGRNKERPEGSYTTYLFEKGREKILKKVGEEAAEVIIAAMKDSAEETVYEIADLCYHTLVLMAQMGIKPEQIKAELEKRHK